MQPVRLILSILSGNCLPKPGGALKGEVVHMTVFHAHRDDNGHLHLLCGHLSIWACYSCFRFNHCVLMCAHLICYVFQIVDPFVHVWIHDPCSSDLDAMEAKTQTVQDNGFNPVWNEVRVALTPCMTYELTKRECVNRRSSSTYGTLTYHTSLCMPWTR